MIIYSTNRVMAHKTQIQTVHEINSQNLCQMPGRTHHMISTNSSCYSFKDELLKEHILLSTNIMKLVTIIIND